MVYMRCKDGGQKGEEKQMKIFMTGGTGFVGMALSNILLDKGHEVIATGTSQNHTLSGQSNFTFISADTTQKGAWQESLSDINAVINLAGRNIFGLWTEDYKNQIYNSRILTTRHIVEALPENRNITFLSTSAAGYYGDQGDTVLDESGNPGHDFLAGVCMDWEKEAMAAKTKGARVVTMRFGVVLGHNGGALSKMAVPFRFFVGGPLGNGLQWFPWIHMTDLMNAVLFLLDTPGLDGPVNFTAPGSVRHKAFARALGTVLHRPSILPLPGVVIRLVMGELGKSFLNSQRVVPEKLTQADFTFTYPELLTALSDIFT